MLGPGYKPTLVFKGSANEVVGPDGQLRSTAAEDFLGNNFPQSIGLKTDYYDRAMTAAETLRSAGQDFDLSGHSLAGGMASAGAAVTGMRAVTFNAAGLHPETAQRFSQEQGGLPLFDADRLVTAWQVQGDLLNDGVQHDLANLGALQRERMAGLLSDAANVVQHVPQARQMLEDKLLSGIPESSHPAIDAFLDRLAQGDAAHLIRDLPQAAGERKPPLVAMTGGERDLVRREHAASLGELHQLAGPLLDVAATSARGARLGREAGEVVAGGGRAVGGGVEWAGDVAGAAWSGAGRFAERGYAFTGTTVQYGAQAAGEVAATARQARAGAEALVDHGQGWAQYQGAQAGAAGLRGLGGLVGLVSDSAREELEARADRLAAQGEQARDRNRGEAATALAQGQVDAAAWRDSAGAAGASARDVLQQAGALHRGALVYVGERLDAGLEVVGTRITGVTSHAPTAGATLGGTTGLVGGIGTTYRLDVGGGVNVYSTVRLAAEASEGMQEAVGRHGMGTAMIPSLDREIAQQEQVARELLQRERQPSRGAPQRDADAGASPERASLGGEFGGALDRLLSAVKNGDGEAFSRASSELMNTPAAQAWLERGRAQAEAIERTGAVASIQQDERAAQASREAVEPGLAR
ncbi:hypothetical protein LDO32_05805 [Luteimonas sp. Y-2-2-4F]|nr:hypothetical protein [Luteimonas sp. Y-2-2-4F]MCD9031242.1 hypothetical protein [Luteimonas sp. Y-2-2-4F]